MKKEKINICWLRRDLRLADNAALYHALKDDRPVLPLFIFDTLILDALENKADARVEFLQQEINSLSRQLQEQGSDIFVFHGTPLNAFAALLNSYEIGTVFINEDYEPYARDRDTAIATFLDQQKIALLSFKDQVIFSKNEILKDDGTPYTVFTPYSKKWKATLTDFHFKSYPTEKFFNNFFKTDPLPVPFLTDLGFQKANKKFPLKQIPSTIIAKYANTRDYPGIGGTSRFGLHLRFGTMSIRALAKEAAESSSVFLGELIWRDFYQMILWHFPQVGKGDAFKPPYENIKWRFEEKEFDRWCKGNTGYPIVDAGMRELNETGFMHNRVRMITASFLTKHLLHDWRLGEAYFAEKLLDYDLAANNGGWQWAAGSGCDAAPYFRIFNPTLQMKKFDKDFSYTRKWVPEFDGLSYPEPMVDHKYARERCIRVYREGLNAR